MSCSYYEPLASDAARVHCWGMLGILVHRSIFSGMYFSARLVKADGVPRAILEGNETQPYLRQRVTAEDNQPVQRLLGRQEGYMRA